MTMPSLDLTRTGQGRGADAVCYVVSVFAPLMVLVCWMMGEMSVRAKLIWTGVYFATWVPAFFVPYVTPLVQTVYALALYFTVFPDFARRWRP